MKAVVYRHKKGLVVEDVPRPAPGPGQALMRVTNCGICGSDLFLYKNKVLSDGVILGHELSGVIEGVGSDVEGLSPGGRVVGRPSGCGTCRACRTGNDNLGRERRGPGFGQYPGGFAEYTVLDRDMLIPVPPEVPLDAGALTDQVATAIHGMRVIGFKEGETALVMGAGTIGLCEIVMLRKSGASLIVASEPQPERAARAREFGADHVLDPAARDFSNSVREIFGPDGMHAVFECSGTAPATLQAVHIASSGARIALVGMCAQSVGIVPMILFQKQLTITGSYGNTQAECRESLDLMARGIVPYRDLITEKISLEKVPEAFDELIGGKNVIKIQTQLGPEL